jgi:O-methyltransferase
MHNLFITQYFKWSERQPSRKVRAFNRVLLRLGIPLKLAPLNETGLMTNVEQRMNLWHLVSQVLAYGVPGDVVELGCHAGQSAVLMQSVIEQFDTSRTLHVYDSFEGLPELAEADGATPFQPGQLAVDEARLLENFDRYGLRHPVIHPGWFDETLPDGLPEAIAFAHLDGDLYDSIRVSLETVYPRLSRGAICLVDDYCDPALQEEEDYCPGVKRACDEFLADKPEEISVLYAGRFTHGFFRKH